MQKLYKRSKILFTLSTRGYIYIYKIFLYVLSLIINILFVVFYNLQTKDFSNHRGNANSVILLLSIINLVISGIFLLFWLCFKYNNEIKINYERYYLIHKRDKKVFILEKIRLIVYHSLIKNPDF